MADMGYFTATWTPGRFPLTDVLSLAAWVDGKDVATEIGNAMYERVLKTEFPGVKMVELNGCIQAFMWTKKPVKTLDDVKGLKIRSPGGHQTNYIKSLGAEPIFMPLGDVYMAMDTGTIDGIVTCVPLILSFKLHEVAKHAVVLTLGCVSEGVIMNEESWKKTPDTLKPVIDDVCHNPFKTTGGLTRDVYKKMMQEVTDKKVELYNLPEIEAERWYDRFRDVTRKWVEDLEAKGLKAKEVVKMYNEECEKRGVKVAAFPKEWK
jgi:TRAP-type C4-dicarboxylate transport system substrate-binding protein